MNFVEFKYDKCCKSSYIYSEYIPSPFSVTVQPTANSVLIILVAKLPDDQSPRK